MIYVWDLFDVECDVKTNAFRRMQKKMEGEAWKKSSAAENEFKFLVMCAHRMKNSDSKKNSRWMFVLKNPNIAIVNP